MLLYVYRLSPASTSVQMSCSVSRSDIIVKSWEFRRNHKPPCSVYIRCRGVNGYVQRLGIGPHKTHIVQESTRTFLAMPVYCLADIPIMHLSYHAKAVY